MDERPGQQWPPRVFESQTHWLEGDVHGVIRASGYTEFTGYTLFVVERDPHLFPCHLKSTGGTYGNAGGAFDALVFTPLDVLGKGFDLHAQVGSKLQACIQVFLAAAEFHHQSTPFSGGNPGPENVHP